MAKKLSKKRKLEFHKENSHLEDFFQFCKSYLFKVRKNSKSYNKSLLVGSQNKFLKISETELLSLLVLTPKQALETSKDVLDFDFTQSNATWFSNNNKVLLKTVVKGGL